jgi:hypothetical protein
VAGCCEYGDEPACSINLENFLTSREPISFSKITLLDRVIYNTCIFLNKVQMSIETYQTPYPIIPGTIKVVVKWQVPEACYQRMYLVRKFRMLAVTLILLLNLHDGVLKQA